MTAQLVALLLVSVAGNVTAGWIIVRQDRQLTDAQNDLEYVISGERPHR